MGRLTGAFDVVPADIDESTRPTEAPWTYVERLAREKAAVVHRQRPGAWVLAADTSVVLGDKILGKPTDDADAQAILEQLSGTTHVVMSGVAVVAPDGSCHAAVEQTEVTFRPLSATDIAAYVATGEGRDKAGSYASQAGGAVFISKLHGCPTDVIGLPLVLTRDLLLRAKFPLVGDAP